MKIHVIKLGSVCTDKATGLKGTITHWLIDMGKRVDYLLQPKALNPEDGQPVKKIMLELERLETTDDLFEEVEVPFEILGSMVTSKSSGFSGMAVNFVRHMNGCFHVSLQPSGLLPKTNSPIQRSEFDLRECLGEKIPELQPAELEKSKLERPSPTDDKFEKYAAGNCSGDSAMQQ